MQMEGQRVVSLLVVALVAAIGALALWIPFGVDQALFAYGGMAVIEGNSLYRDFWDIKPPGIFFFFAIAGRTLGFSEVGIHGVELLWQLALALVLLRIALLAVTHRVAAALAPLAAIGTYYAWADGSSLTQVEALVGLPVSASLLLAHRICLEPRSSGPAICLGLAAGAVAAMKPLYLLLPLAFVLLAFILSRGVRRGETWRDVWFLATRCGFGFGLLWLPMLGYFALNGTLAEMLWTTFAFPEEALREVPAAPLDRLTDSIASTARIYAPWSPLLLCGLWALRRPVHRFSSLGTALYLILAMLLILVQKISWWEYHFVLLFPPLGLLASLGLDRLTSPRESRRAPRWAVGALTAAVLVLPIFEMGRQSWEGIRRLMAARGIQSDAPLAVRLDPDYLAMWEKTRFLRDTKETDAGSIYAFGDFRWVLLSGRRQAIAVHGHAWHHLPDRFWRDLPAELVAAEPAYIFVGGFYNRLLRQRSPQLWEHIQQHYRPVRRYKTGRWYRRRPPVSQRSNDDQIPAAG